MDKHRVLFILKTKGKTAMNMDKELYAESEAYKAEDVAELAKECIKWLRVFSGLDYQDPESCLNDYDKVYNALEQIVRENEQTKTDS